MTSNETAKSPGGSPANVHFRALRPDPAAASFTLWKPLAAGFTSRKRKWNMLHFHGHQSADAVPGKLHNDVDIANWLCKKSVLFRRETCRQNPTDDLSVHLCAWGSDPFLIGMGGDWDQEASLLPEVPVLALVPKGGSRRAHVSAPCCTTSLEPWHRARPQPYMIRWVTLLALLSCPLQEESSESRRP